MSSPPESLPTITRRSSNDQIRIRSKLLNRLGIYDAPASVRSQQPMTAAQVRRHRILRGMGVGHTLNPSPPDGSAFRLPLDGVQSFQEKLKTDAPPPDVGKIRKIAFQDDVEVMPIPTRYEYSDRIKSRIWSNRHELQENAERNAMEFAAEGWDWRTVTEDEGMFICSVSGELVHPIHLQHMVPDEEQKSGSLERGGPVH